MRRLAPVSAVLLGGAVILASGACVDLTNLAGGGGTDGGPAPGVDASLPITLSPASLDFGVAGCGTPVPPQTVSLENTGSSPLAYEASLPEESGFALGGQHITTTNGTVPPGGRTSFTIAVDSLRTLGALATKLTIKVGDDLRTVPITVTGLGARLDADRQVVDYGDVFYTATAQVSVMLSNPGTEDITVTSLGNLGTDFAVAKTSPLPLVVPKAGSTKLDVILIAGAAGQLPDRTVTVETDAKPLCGDKPSLSFRAKRVNTFVTINPGTVDFGKQSCGVVPPQQTVTITNYGPSESIVSAMSGLGSRFNVQQGQVKVPPMMGSTPGTATLGVKALVVTAPVGVVAETVQLVVDGQARSITLRMDARGVVLDMSPTLVNFSYIGQKRIVGVTNSGNENAITSYTSDSIAFTPGPGDTIFPGAKSNMEIVYTAPDSAMYTGTVKTTLTPATTVACSPLPVVNVETK